MTLNEILDRLKADGYEDCHIVDWAPKSIIVPNFGEVELAYGEATIFDKKYPWPEYGDHRCFTNIDDLFDDIHKTWPLETQCKPSSDSSKNSSPVKAAAEIAIKGDCLVIVTGGENDSQPDQSGSVQVGDQASPVRLGLDAERRTA